MLLQNTFDTRFSEAQLQTASKVRPLCSVKLSFDRLQFELVPLDVTRP
jgi:hypothetical protein